MAMADNPIANALEVVKGFGDAWLDFEWGRERIEAGSYGAAHAPIGQGGSGGGSGGGSTDWSQPPAAAPRSSLKGVLILAAAVVAAAYILRR